MAEKREEYQTTMRRARQTTNDEIAAEFIRNAEALNAEIHTLEQDYADARDELDRWHAESAWVDATLKQIYEHSVIREMPLPEDIRQFPLEERRLLLAASGLRAVVYPKGWTVDMELGFH